MFLEGDFGFGMWLDVFWVAFGSAWGFAPLGFFGFGLWLRVFRVAFDLGLGLRSFRVTFGLGFGLPLL